MWRQGELIGVPIMPELSTVEYDYDLNKYVAILSNGERLVLDAKGLRAAEQEAYDYLLANEFTGFSAPPSWEK